MSPASLLTASPNQQMDQALLVHLSVIVCCPCKAMTRDAVSSFALTCTMTLRCTVMQGDWANRRLSIVLWKILLYYYIINVCIEFPVMAFVILM